jgi:glycerol-3-phosphate dehydrogenase (NAD(P)+)
VVQKVNVIGDGAWGTALAMLLAENGHMARLWGRFPAYTAELRRTRRNAKFLPDVAIPEAVELIGGPDLPPADLTVCAVPTPFIRETFAELAGRLDPGTPIVSVAKGIERGTHLRPTQILRDAVGARTLAAVSGPSHAEEVARRLPATVAVGSDDAAFARRVQELFGNDRFRIYTSDDPVGMELAGALKNIMAIGAGICDGLGLGDNAKAALISRGVIEMARIGVALGAQKRTFFGISGIGDLVTTCYSPHGRNLAVGRKIGAGARPADVLAGMEQVAEGVWTTQAVLGIPAVESLELPITREVAAVLFEGKEPRRAVGDLMRRPPRSESEDLA